LLLRGCTAAAAVRPFDVIARLSIIPPDRIVPGDELPPGDRARMFRLGLIEVLPLVSGGICVAFGTMPIDGLLCGVGAILLSLLLCWCLRHRTPDTRIELAAAACCDANGDERHDHAKAIGAPAAARR
jgi:hypothetical protein